MLTVWQVQSYTDPKFFALLMVPVGECNLYEYYELAAKSPDKLTLLRSFFGCLATALEYIHSIKIRHRDIKPQNVLVKGHRVLLTDFGIALDWENLSRSTTTADSGKTLIYAAPEVIRYERRNTSADVWSLGCVFLEMVTILKGETISRMRAFFEALSGNCRIYANVENVAQWINKLRSVGREKDNAILNWVRAMLAEEAKDRLTAAEVCADIVHESKTQQVVFCGSCCLEVADSSGAEDFDADDLWGEAVEMALQPAISR
jgi:serine/threonine protein kinase